MRLIPCPSCHSHVLVDDRQCPHCGTALQTTAAPRVAGALLLGLALTGCPSDDGDDTAGGSSTTATTAPTTASTTDGTSTEDSVSGSGGVDYGTGDFGDDTDTTGSTGTGTDSTTGDTDSVGEPEYGVPGTTTGGTDSVGEPDYGVPTTG